MQILNTSLFKPEISSSHLKRERLSWLFSANLDKKIHLVIAPSGYGKSLAISHWLESITIKYSWLSLNDNFNDIQGFLAHLHSGINKQCPNALTKLLPIISALRLPDINYIANVLSNELLEIPNKLIIVLDDYHGISNQEVHDLIHILLSNLPDNIRVVISSRKTLPFNSSKWIAYNEVHEVTLNHLKFNMEEFETLSSKLLKDTIDKNYEKELFEYSEGWIVGILLLLKNIATQPKWHQNSSQNLFRQSHIVDYVNHELLASEELLTKRCLVIASLFDRFTLNMVSQLYAELDLKKSAFKCIETLSDDGFLKSFFLIPLDNTKTWFRLHHFMKHFLEFQSKEVFSKSELKKIFKSASHYFEEKEFIDEAIQIAIKGDHTALAIDIIHKNRDLNLKQENFLRIKRWFELIPFEAVQLNPPMLILRTILFESLGDFKSMFNDLKQAKVLLFDKKKSNAESNIIGEYYAMQSGAAFKKGNLQLSITASRKAIDMLSPENTYMYDYAIAHFVFANNKLNRNAKAENLLNTLEAQLPKSNHTQLAHLKLIRAMHYSYNADFVKSKSSAFIAKVVSDTKSLKKSQLMAYTFLASSEYMHNSIDSALCSVEQGLSFNYTGHPFYSIKLHFLRAQCFLVQQDYKKAEMAINEMNSFASQFGIKDYEDFSKLLTSEIHLQQNNIDVAYNNIKNIELNNQQLTAYFNYYPRLTKAKLLLFDGKYQDLQKAEHMLLGYLTDTFNKNILIQVKCLQAILYHKKSKTKKAIELLKETLALSEKGGGIRFYLDLAPEMRLLFNQLKKQDREPEFVNEIMLQLQAPKSILKTSPEKATTATAYSNLNTKELKILNLVAKGYTNLEIARELDYSQGTIKTYLSTIYKKIGVKNRVQAITIFQKNKTIFYSG